jgi:hypothetical protein
MWQISEPIKSVLIFEGMFLILVTLILSGLLLSLSYANRKFLLLKAILQGTRWTIVGIIVSGIVSESYINAEYVFESFFWLLLSIGALSIVEYGILKIESLMNEQAQRRQFNSEYT